MRSYDDWRKQTSLLLAQFNHAGDADERIAALDGLGSLFVAHKAETEVLRKALCLLVRNEALRSLPNSGW
jgi:hypothetical protein